MMEIGRMIGRVGTRVRRRQKERWKGREWKIGSSPGPGFEFEPGGIRGRGGERYLFGKPAVALGCKADYGAGEMSTPQARGRR